jgi:hypothetical protein
MDYFPEGVIFHISEPFSPILPVVISSVFRWQTAI